MIPKEGIIPYPGGKPYYGKIDIHTHMQHGEKAVEMRLQANEYLGFTKCVLLPGVDNPSFRRMGPPFLSEDAYALAQKYPEHFTWLCNLIPDGTDATYEKLKKYKEMGAAGLGEFGTRYRFDDPRMDHLFACLEELNMPFLFHMAPANIDPYYGVVDDPRMPGLERALAKFPNLIIVGHSQPFWFEITKTNEMDHKVRNSAPYGKVTEPGRVTELLRKYPNLYCDLSANSASSALMRDPDHALRFIEEFQDRLMFGTDWSPREGGMPFVFPLSSWLDFMHMKGQISDEAYEKVCFRNAEKIFFS